MCRHQDLKLLLFFFVFFLSHSTWNTGRNWMVSQTCWLYFRYPLFKELIESILIGSPFKVGSPFKIKLERRLNTLYITFEGNWTEDFYLPAEPDTNSSRLPRGNTWRVSPLHARPWCTAVFKPNFCQTQLGVKQNHVFTEERLPCHSSPPPKM